MTKSADFYRDAFLDLLAKGFTHFEALETFDRDEWNEAMTAEIMSGDCKQFDRSLLHYITASGKPSLLDLAGKAVMESCDREALEQAHELWMAGWTSEPVTPKSQVMSWYWRRPPRRAGKPGRKYLSTNQAWMALKREAEKR